MSHGSGVFVELSVGHVGPTHPQGWVVCHIGWGYLRSCPSAALGRPTVAGKSFAKPALNG